MSACSPFKVEEVDLRRSCHWYSSAGENQSTPPGLILPWEVMINTMPMHHHLKSLAASACTTRYAV